MASIESSEGVITADLSSFPCIKDVCQERTQQDESNALQETNDKTALPISSTYERMSVVRKKDDLLSFQRQYDSDCLKKHRNNQQTYYKLAKEASEHKKEETLIMQSATDFLPPVLLVNHGFADLITDRYVKRAIAIINTALTQRLSYAWDHWVVVHEDGVRVLKEFKASKIQHIIRQFIAKCKMERLRTIRDEAERNRLERLDMVTLYQLQMVVCIQSAIRGFKVRKMMWYRLHRSKAADRVQGWWRCIMFHFRCIDAMIQVRCWIQASRIIQCKFRQYLSKNRCYRLKTQRSNIRYQTSSSMSSSYHRFFLVYGSCVVIQHWWMRGIRWRNAKKYHALLAREVKYRNNCATKIETMVRKWLAKLMMLRMRMKMMKKLEDDLYCNHGTRIIMMMMMGDDKAYLWLKPVERDRLIQISSCISIQASYRCHKARTAYTRSRYKDLTASQVLLHQVKLKMMMLNGLVDPVGQAMGSKYASSCEWIVNRCCDLDVMMGLPFQVSGSVQSILAKQRSTDEDDDDVAYNNNERRRRRSGMQAKLSDIKFLLPFVSSSNYLKYHDAGLVLQSLFIKAKYELKKRRIWTTARKIAMSRFIRLGLLLLVRTAVKRIIAKRKFEFEFVFRNRIARIILKKMIYPRRITRWAARHVKSVSTMQSACVNYLTRRKRRLNGVRQRFEVCSSGKLQYDATFTCCCWKECLNGLLGKLDESCNKTTSRLKRRTSTLTSTSKTAKPIKPDVMTKVKMNEIEALYKLYANADTGEMDVTRFSKLMKDIPNLIQVEADGTSALTSNYVQVIFTRVVSRCNANDDDGDDDGGSNKMNLLSFAVALVDVAKTRFGQVTDNNINDDDDDVVVSSSSSSVSKLSDVLLQLKPINKLLTRERNEKFGHFYRVKHSSILKSLTDDDDRGQIIYPPFIGWQGWLVKLMALFVSNSKKWDQVGCLRIERAKAKTMRSCISIQKQFRGHLIRQFVYPKFKSTQIQRRINDKQCHAAVVIQTLIRGFSGKMRSARLAQVVYIRMVEHSANSNGYDEYYLNQKNGNRLNAKPFLYRGLPSGIAVPTPKRNRSYSIMCSVCKTNLSKVHCHECDEPYCLACFPSYHKSQSRSFHHAVAQDCCSMCCIQVSTKYCSLCYSNGFCDTCCLYFHSKTGRLRFHRYKPIVQVCQECRSWSSQVTCDGIMLCLECLQLRQTSESIVVPINYVGRPLTKFRTDLLKQEEARLIQSQYEEGKQRHRNQMLNCSATDIQRVWRSHSSRVQSKDLVQERKEWLRTRLIDDLIRQKIWYRAVDTIGLAPELISDTPKESVEKKFVIWARGSLGNAVLSWKTAFDEYLLDKTSVNVVHTEYGYGSSPLRKMLYAINLSKLLFVSCPSLYLSSFSSDRNFQAVEDKLDKILRDLRQAQANGKSDKVTRPMIESAGVVQKELAVLKLENDEVNSNHRNAINKTMTALIGPSGLKHHVSQLYHTGKSLPFTVSLITGKRCIVIDYDSIVTSKRDEFNWKRHLCYGDYIRVAGVVCRVYRHAISITSNDDDGVKDKKSVLDLRQRISLQRQELNDDDDDDASSDDEDDDDDDDDGIDRAVFDENADTDLSWADWQIHLKDRKKLERDKRKLKWTLDAVDVDVSRLTSKLLIPIDRSWSLDSCNHQQAFKEVRLPVLKNSVLICDRLIVNSAPSQLMLSSALKALEAVKKKLIWFKSVLDDDGEMVVKVDVEIKKLSHRQDGLKRLIQNNVEFNDKSLADVYNDTKRQVKVARRIMRYFYIKYGRKIGIVEPEQDDDDDEEVPAENAVEAKTST